MRKHGRQVTDTEFCSTALNDETHALDGLVDVASWPRLCENAKAINRDRTTYSFKIVLGPTSQRHSTLKSNVRISFSYRFELLSFHTGWARLRLSDCSRKCNAITRATKTIREMKWFEVVQTRGHIEKGSVRHYQVTLRVGFTLEE